MWVDLREIGWGGKDWIHLAQDRDQRKALVNTIINPRVAQNFGKFLSICTTGGSSRRVHLHGVIWLIFRNHKDKALVCLFGTFILKSCVTSIQKQSAYRL
jgi:hypothetical protein